MSEHLEELKKRLYKSGESFEKRLDNRGLTPNLEKPPLLWKEGASPAPTSAKAPMPVISKKRKKWIWIASSASLIAAAVFYYFIFYNSVSANRIDINVSSPQSVSGGDRVTWEISVTNKNKRALESADLIFEYPQGSEILDEGVRGLRARKTLGRIESGETLRFAFSAYVFGFEGEEKEAHTILEYKPHGSNAILSKDVGSKLKISRAPVGVSFDIPKEIRMGQEMDIKINYVSNSAGILENLILEFEAPSGFLYKDADPEPEAGERSWVLPALDPGEKKTITIKGILSGGELEEKSFKASIGIRSSLGELSIYGQGISTVKLRRPFLEVDAKISGQESYAAKPGDIVEMEINYRNNLDVPVENVVIEGILSGTGIDERQIKVFEGSYISANKKIIFNSSSAMALGKIDPGEGGTLRVQLAFLSNMPIKSSRDREFKPSIHFTVRPGVIPQGFSGVDLTGEDTLDIKIISRMQFVRKGIHFASAIQNSGPMPPKVGQETTFTITWSLTNSTNDLRDVVVKATLPAYINWKTRFLPQSASINFDPNTGEIRWNVGEMKAGVGYISPAREASFQIGFIPSPAQVGQSPDLVLAASAEGRDTFTDAFLQVFAPSQTLELEDDPRVDSGGNTVLP